MDPREMESLTRRLIQNPHDEDALMSAHQAGQADPKTYATILEKVGNNTPDPAFACHWLTEAANVWLVSLRDAPHAARDLMQAIERDPTQPTPAERLADLYRERGDTKALVALLERRGKALAPLAAGDPGISAQAAQLYEELGRLWSEPPLSQPRKAQDNFRRAIEMDSGSQYAIYALREMLKAEGEWAEAIPYFEMEQRLVGDPERKLALFQDEATVRHSAGDRAGAAETLRQARGLEGGNDPTLKQMLATMTLERVQTGERVSDSERGEAAQLFVELSEQFPGEHGLSYAACALEVEPANDRAVQLAMYYGEELGRDAEVAQAAARYLKANHGGAMAASAREFVNRLAQAGLGDDALFDALAPTADAPAEERIMALLDQASALARKARKPEAAEKYAEILSLDPANEDAVTFLEGYYRQRRKYAELRDLLRQACDVEDLSHEVRRNWLRELAGLCETQLRDTDTAIKAWQDLAEMDLSDEGPKEQLRRLLERAGRWDDLVALLESDAEQESDIERRVSMERTIAKINEQKRRDPVATGQTWARIASLVGDDESAIVTAVRNFEKGERLDLAAQVIGDNVGSVSDEHARAELLQKLGSVREALADWVGAGEAYCEAASVGGQNAALLEEAERCFVEAEAWGQAASVVDDQAQNLSVPSEQARLYAVVYDYLSRAGDAEGALQRLEQATQLDPSNDGYAEILEKVYSEAGRHEDLVELLLLRAERITDKERRVQLRKKASVIQRDTLENPETARETLQLVLTDGDDIEVLSLLAEDAEQRDQFDEVADYLHRLAKVLEDPGQKIEVLLREASVFADQLQDPKGALDRYAVVLSDYDENNVEALTAMARIYDELDDPAGVAEVLERHLALQPESGIRLDLATRLADLYEQRLDDPAKAIAKLDVVREIDSDNFDALDRLVALSEKVEDWPRLARHLAERVAVEGDDEVLSRITRQLASIYHENLGKDDEALAALIAVADLGDAECRQEYVMLADELGWKGIVATKLVEWNLEAPNSPQRNEALRGAFERFLVVGREAEAAAIAHEIVRARAADQELAKKLEEIAVRLKDLDTLELAHDLLSQELSGAARAEEMVRQAEVLAGCGVEVVEAIQHGEQALTSVSPDEVEPLLERLSKLGTLPEHTLDLYERQVTRCKAPNDRLRALGRAAQVAIEKDAPERARDFLDIALGGSIQQDTIAILYEIARETDETKGDQALRRSLAAALAAGGQGSKDGGRTRSTMLRRAAQLMFEELKDVDQAFAWLSDAIVAHVDDEGLEELDGMARQIGDLRRAESVLGRALEEVFDGPLVRKLLARRADLRRADLDDMAGAAQDLRRLHDISPGDQGVIEQLSELYTSLGDYRGLVQLLEDQILRGKNPAGRVELARKVARLWEERLADAREAADAWRRVLRLKPGDPEATEGLDRAKSNMLKHPSGSPFGASSSLGESEEEAETVDRAPSEEAEAGREPPPAEMEMDAHPGTNRGDKRDEPEEPVAQADEFEASPPTDRGDLMPEPDGAVQGEVQDATPPPSDHGEVEQEFEDTAAGVTLPPIDRGEAKEESEGLASDEAGVSTKDDESSVFVDGAVAAYQPELPESEALGPESELVERSFGDTTDVSSSPVAAVPMSQPSDLAADEELPVTVSLQEESEATESGSESAGLPVPKPTESPEAAAPSSAVAHAPPLPPPPSRGSRPPPPARRSRGKPPPPPSMRPPGAVPAPPAAGGGLNKPPPPGQNRPLPPPNRDAVLNSGGDEGDDDTLIVDDAELIEGDN